MSETMAKVHLPDDNPLRYPLLIEMTRIDLSNRWKTGERIFLEEYIESYPELGSVHTVSVDLLRAEYSARKAHGDHVEVGEYAKRFPNQYPAFHRLFKPAHAPVLPDLDDLQSAVDMPPVAPRHAIVTTRHAAPHPRAAAPIPHTAPKRRSLLTKFAMLFLLLVAGFLGWMGYKGGFNDPKKFFAELVGGNKPAPSQPDVPSPPQKSLALQSLTVKLDLGAGEDLQEAVALDLGLGFPLWLVPAGAQPPTLPFGAVPQSATAIGKVPAGGSATFTFLAAGEPGQDLLTTTPQLLAGVKIGDIRRVGFTGLAQQDWELSGYEIQVNGKTLHSASGLKVRPKQLQDEALKKLAGLNTAAAPVSQELTDLRDLAQSGLASENEKARLAELEKQTAATPSLEETMLLERQLQGKAPWFVEKIPEKAVATAAPSRDLLDLAFDLLTPRALAAAEAVASPPRSVRVTVVTDTALDQSDTSNYVYFIAGSHKHLIGSPESPLTSNNGPQVFDLDLAAAPLDASDLRGFGLGMLAPPKAKGKGPDRWHPSHVQVEVDGKTVYDSELVPTDRQTLAAIRLVPPTQLDLDGVTVVKNPSSSRELYIWEAGKGTGFDPRTSSMDPLPPGTFTENGEQLGGPDGIVQNPTKPLDLSNANDLKKLFNFKTPIDPNTLIIPSKVIDPTDPADLSIPNDPNQPFNQAPNVVIINNVPPPQQGFPNSVAFPGQVPRINPATPFNPAQPQVNPAQPQAPIVVFIPQPPPAPLPPVSTKPVNPPKAPLIDSVAFVQLSKGVFNSCTITIAWTIADDSGVDRYDVSLQGMEDDLSGTALMPRGGQPSTSIFLGTRLRGAGNLITVSVPIGFLLDYRFVVPVVRPVPALSSINAMAKVGPIRSTSPLKTQEVVDASFTGLQQIQGPPLAVTSPSGFRIPTSFDAVDPNGARVVQLDGIKPEVTMSLTCNDLQAHEAPKTIRFYTGFSGGNAFGTTMEYRVKAFAIENIPGKVTTTIPLRIVSVPGKSVDPTSGFFAMNGADFKMDAVSIDLSAPLPDGQSATSKIQNSNNRWTIEMTISMRKFKSSDLGPRPPVVFDAVILRK